MYYKCFGKGGSLPNSFEFRSMLAVIIPTLILHFVKPSVSKPMTINLLRNLTNIIQKFTIKTKKFNKLVKNNLINKMYN